MVGKLFVIESGTDGSGKATQTKKLYDRLVEDGYRVRKVEFPNYESESSSIIKMYLRGDFGDKAGDVDAYVASTFYAVDRYASYKLEWEKFYLDGGIILADRYTTSNMVHQASKMDTREEKEKFLEWLEEFEYGLYKIPRPDRVFFLDVPLRVSAKLMEERKNKFTNEDAKDIHERDLEYLSKTYDNAKYVAEKFDWTQIDCTDGMSMKTVEDINDDIYSRVIDAINN